MVKSCCTQILYCNLSISLPLYLLLRTVSIWSLSDLRCISMVRFLQTLLYDFRWSCFADLMQARVCGFLSLVSVFEGNKISDSVTLCFANFALSMPRILLWSQYFWRNDTVLSSRADDWQIKLLVEGSPYSFCGHRSLFLCRRFADDAYCWGNVTSCSADFVLSMLHILLYSFGGKMNSSAIDHVRVKGMSTRSA